jgi:hypothetical protein
VTKKDLYLIAAGKQRERERERERKEPGIRYNIQRQTSLTYFFQLGTTFYGFHHHQLGNKYLTCV